jgi:hypothetical protein
LRVWKNARLSTSYRRGESASDPIRASGRPMARAAIVLDITEGAQPILAKLRSRQSL